MLSTAVEGGFLTSGVDGRPADTSNPAVSDLSRRRTAGQATTPPAVIQTHTHARATDGLFLFICLLLLFAVDNQNSTQPRKLTI